MIVFADYGLQHFHDHWASAFFTSTGLPIISNINDIAYYSLLISRAENGYHLVLSAEATYPSCSKRRCHQRKGSYAQNKRAQSVLTFMAKTTNTLLNGLRFTLRKALLSYMLTLTLCLQEYHISFLHALQTICYMGDPSP